ncbi:MAG: 3',5'-cyclic nucleotide phosphodiesterase [Chlamydiia bacterium]|nr:3',5'-cyclic nucleotide phosphodiesterase [Chlamydiia bacterium]
MKGIEKGPTVRIPTQEDLQRDPLLLFLRQKPAFDPDQDAALFDRLVQDYTAVADVYLAQRQDARLDGPASLSNEFNSLAFDTLRWASNEEFLVESVIKLFDHFKLLQQFRIDKERLKAFIFAIKEHYHLVSYHNFLHAVDATQFIGYLLIQGGLGALLEPFDILCLLLTALGHDLGHPGASTSFDGHLRVFTGQTVDGDTLEECHLKLLLQLVQNKRIGIASNWSLRQLSIFKQMAAAQIAATDMNNHLVALYYFDHSFQHIPSDKHGELAYRRFLTQLAIKCADISNVVRPLQISQKWTRALSSELHATDACEVDITSKAIGNSQVAFIDYIAKPLFAALYLTLPETGDCLWNLQRNRDQWTLGS